MNQHRSAGGNHFIGDNRILRHKPGKVFPIACRLSRTLRERFTPIFDRWYDRRRIHSQYQSLKSRSAVLLPCSQRRNGTRIRNGRARRIRISKERNRRLRLHQNQVLQTIQRLARVFRKIRNLLNRKPASRSQPRSRPIGKKPNAGSRSQTRRGIQSTPIYGRPSQHNSRRLSITKNPRRSLDDMALGPFPQRPGNTGPNRFRRHPRNNLQAQSA